MKNTRLFRGKRRLIRKATLHERIRRSLERLPKWRQKYLFQNEQEKKYVVNQMAFNVLDAKGLGVRTNIYRSLYRQTSSLSRKTSEETFRYIYKKFRQESYFYLTYKRNMTKLGLAYEQYFYKNAEIETEGYISDISIPLPNNFDKEGSKQLIFKFDWRDNEITLIYFD